MSIEELEEALNYSEKKRKLLGELVGDLLWALRNAESVDSIRGNAATLLDEYQAYSDSPGVRAGSLYGN